MYDLRGHGMSSLPVRGFAISDMCRDLRLLLDHLGVDRAHVVGHSYGARVALGFAGWHPDRIHSLTVADTQVHALQPPIRLREWPYWERWKRDLLATGLRQLPEDDAWIDFRLLARLGQYGGDLADGSRPMGLRRLSVRRRVLGAREQRRWGRLLETPAAVDELSQEAPLTIEFLGGIAAPTLLLFGRFSHCLPSAERLFTIMPDARKVIVPGAGHFFPVVKPRFFARAFKRFIKFRRLDRSALSEAEVGRGRTYGAWLVPGK